MQEPLFAYMAVEASDFLVNQASQQYEQFHAFCMEHGISKSSFFLQRSAIVSTIGTQILQREPLQQARQRLQ